MRYLLLGGVIALSLVGCTSTIAEPEPPAGAELQHFIDEQQRREPVVTELGGVFEFSFNGSTCLERSQQFLADFDVTAISDAEVLRLGGLFEDEMKKCESAVLSPNEAGYFSTAQLDYLYDYYQDTLVPCLQLQGLDVGFAPSRSEFASVAGWVSWDPYSELGAAVPPSRSAEIRSRCPGYPAAGFLAGQ